VSLWRLRVAPPMGCQLGAVGVALVAALSGCAHRASASTGSAPRPSLAERTEEIQSRFPQRAVAYSPSTGVCGFTTVDDRRDSALAEAVTRCGAGDCQANAHWVLNGCIAYARGAGGRAGWSLGATRGEAMRGALRQCAAVASGCEEACWTCTDYRY